MAIETCGKFVRGFFKDTADLIAQKEGDPRELVEYRITNVALGILTFLFAYQTCTAAVGIFTAKYAITHLYYTVAFALHAVLTHDLFHLSVNRSEISKHLNGLNSKKIVEICKGGWGIFSKEVGYLKNGIRPELQNTLFLGPLEKAAREQQNQH